MKWITMYIALTLTVVFTFAIIAWTERKDEESNIIKLIKKPRKYMLLLFGWPIIGIGFVPYSILKSLYVVLVKNRIPWIRYPDSKE